MSSALFVLWIALIGADRIDLAGGHGPFILTPFLALTPFVMFAEWARVRLAGRALIVDRKRLGYAALAGVFLSLAMLSVFIAPETQVSAARVFLLVADVAATFAIAVLCSDRTDLHRLLA